MPDPTGTNLTEAEAKQINASAPISQTFKTGERLRNLRTDLQELREVGCTLTAAAQAGNSITVTLQAQRDGASVAEAGIKYLISRYDDIGDVNTASFSIGPLGNVTKFVTTDANGQATFDIDDGRGSPSPAASAFVVAEPFPSGKSVSIELSFAEIP